MPINYKLRYNNLDRYFVYIYLDPRKPGKYVYGELIFDYEPFYAGKGSRERHTHHLSYAKRNTKTESKSIKVRKINKIILEELEPIIKKLKIGMTDRESYDYEEEVIKTIGRQNINTGPLTNLRPGGYIASIESAELRKRIVQGQKRVQCSEETKKKISDKNKGKSPPNKGKRGIQKSWNKGMKTGKPAWNKGVKAKTHKEYQFIKGEELIIITDLQQYCIDNKLNYAAMNRLNSKGIPHYDTTENYYKGYVSPKFKTEKV